MNAINSKKNDILIRKIKKNDLIDILELLQLISKFKPQISSLNHLWDNQLLKQKNFYAFVAILDERIVGYGSVAIQTGIRGGKIGYIENIVTHPNFKNKGIGKTILETLFNISKANNCYKIILQCKEENVGFYKKCNYDVSGIAMQRFIKK